MVWLRLGAKRLRCEFCRLNFAGFRPVKVAYSSRFGRHYSTDPATPTVSDDDDE
ncbi:MAG: hypothetical protein JNL62_30730 [Bryobacterales bacterium]|nr:hypothetical protein [Bryobacterales bacterium]